ncbi:hypothetical protein VTN00DRAFT_1474 [Thermoascus crustaceus]|uniref:uncharacterized protein n=1 Tax=Thermoascus crustaceus TaxID=5088 RepID=UPI003743F7CB
MADERRDRPRTGAIARIVTRSPVAPVLASVAARAGPERLRFTGASGSPQREKQAWRRHKGLDEYREESN